MLRRRMPEVLGAGIPSLPGDGPSAEKGTVPIAPPPFLPF
jgi:hypothetical protein